MENKTFQLLEKMYIEFSERFEKLENKFDELENEVKKNSVLLEKNNKDIKTLAEVQENHINQNIKQHEEIINKLECDLSTIKTSIKSISKDLKFIEHKEFQNEKAIFDLKNDIKVIK
jgi:archaellum component FlaC